ncbi:phosphotransferase enzyme family protein [Brevibacterium linens]|uniref:Ser/Thr protein kinase RdoA involved in Cpx stress response, MazF antagonist n=1 Tax=Brevibacterium linens ATCC 9172 TaxID=1255617 RepID=A0A2H1IN60_BRELN|nr:phosphotransferase [Brevibacterium linens]KAB1946789.1 phosphotransferase [Brevibacterium linens ATCC 9172]SMX76596.1 Ser/Thr protein kinase RdoA involved in Cpx stress response, MazF antagonist [Brevibacterium linens ATCC 9172]
MSNNDELATETSAAEDLAREALPAFELPADTSLTLLKHRENSVFALNHLGDHYVLRVHRQGYHTDEELDRELEFVRSLERLGVPVPRFIPVTKTQNFVHVGHAHPAGVHQVDLQAYIANDGNFGDEHSAFHGTANHTPDDFHHLGELIAQVHQATIDSGFAVNDSHPRWNGEGLVGEDALWGAPLRVAELHSADNADALSTLASAIEVIRTSLDEYGHSPHRYGPIHADLTPENVLRTEAGLVLIDFDDFASGWHLFDLATALYFFLRHPRGKEYQEALLTGYQQHRRLEPADFAVFPALLVARGLTYLGWAADRRGEPAAEFHVHEVLPHLVELASSLITAQKNAGATT